MIPTMPDANFNNPEVAKAFTEAPEGTTTKLLISEGVSYRETQVERNIYKSEELTPELLRIQALNSAVGLARQDYSTTPVEKVVKDAAVILAFLTDGTVPAEVDA